MLTKRTAPLAVGIIAAMITTAACSSSGDGGGNSTSSTSASTGSASTSGSATTGGAGDLAVAQAAVKAAMENPKPINLPPLSATAPKDKTIAFVSCPIPECQTQGEEMKKAVALLGWTLKIVNVAGYSPDQINSAIQSAVSQKPDGIAIVETTPTPTLSPGLNAAKAANIPVIGIAASGEVEPPVIANFEGYQESGPAAVVLAQWMIADSEGKANVAVYDTTANKSAHAASTNAVETVKSCSGCTGDDVIFKQEDVGTALPQQVVSYLQRHTKVNYLFFPYGSATTGVAAALKTAGLADKVKISSVFATTANFSSIKNGTEAAGIAEEQSDIAWRTIDTLARHFLGDDLEILLKAPYLGNVGQRQLLVKDNIGSFDITKPWITPDIAATYKAIWKL